LEVARTLSYQERPALPLQQWPQASALATCSTCAQASMLLLHAMTTMPGWGYGYSQMSQIRPERLHKGYRFVCSRDGVILRRNYQAAAIAARVDRSHDVASLVAQRNRDCAQSKHHLLVDDQVPLLAALGNNASDSWQGAAGRMKFRRGLVDLWVTVSASAPRFCA
jgi:hypothetical protein